jgi:hypothetical protein
MARIGEHLLVDPALPSIIGQPELSTSRPLGPRRRVCARSGQHLAQIA